MTDNDVTVDALHPDPAASYERAAAMPYASEREQAIISAQIGRPSRGASAIMHRCRYGLPTVIRVEPRLRDGTPFPTTFWQTCPKLGSAIGTLEADGMMVGLNERVQGDEAYAAEHLAQHLRHLGFRDALGGALPSNAGAGGMPTGVKCLHVMAGHELATGDNAMGREVLERALPLACDGPCVSETEIATELHALRRREAQPRAAVDIGSNSVRLLVVDAHGTELHRELEVTRISAGIDVTGHLDDAGLAKTLAAITRYADVWRAAGVADRDVVMAATSAVRDASDRRRFLVGARDAVNVNARVLTGSEEATMAHRGAAVGLPVELRAAMTRRGFAVLDIGGGSTELAVGDGRRLRNGASLQLGSVRITERWLHDDPPSEEQVAAARADVRAILASGIDEDLDDALRSTKLLVGTAGTVTTIAALDAGHGAWQGGAVHGLVLSAERVHELTERLLGMTVDERLALGPIPPGRADVIAGGALVLDEVLTRWGMSEIRISETDNLDGLLV